MMREPSNRQSRGALAARRRVGRTLGDLWVLAGLGLLLIGVGAGCRHAEARALPEIPLDMPAPPPRLVEVADPQDPLIVPLPEEPVTSSPSRRVAPPVRTETRPPDPRPEVVADAPRTEEPGRTVVAPPPTLQTVPTQQESEADRKVRLQLSQTSNVLARINVRSLNGEARQQLETAKGFVRQAEEALQVRNLVFASNLAEKAASIAAQLSGR